MGVLTRVVLGFAAFTWISGSVASATAHAQGRQPEQPTTVDASGGGVTIASGPNSLTIGARVQFRWLVEDRDRADADTTGTGVGQADGFVNQFDVPRLRMTFSGGVYQPWLRYSFQLEFSRTPGAGASKIKDALIEIRPTGRAYRLQMGQFKAPYGLQQLVSSGRLQFVERAITDVKFTPGRDMGVMLSGTAAAQRMGYHAGVFNGSGESQTQTTRSALFVGRAFYNPLGPYPLTEGAVDAGPRPVLHIGVAARNGKQIRGRTAAGVVENADNQTSIAAEFGYRRPRFHATAEYFWATEELRNPVVGPDLDSRGYHAQAGYMIEPRTIEIGIRFAEVTGNTAVDDAAVREIRGVLGYYWRAHNVKLQADAGQLRYGRNFTALSARARAGLPALGTRLASGVPFADTQIRVQMQVGF